MRWHDQLSVCFYHHKVHARYTLALARHGWAGAACQISRCCCTHIKSSSWRGPPRGPQTTVRACQKLWLLRRPVTEDGEELMGSSLNSQDTAARPADLLSLPGAPPRCVRSE
eukprot:COSAG01_NODE_32_length_35644_cov_22.273738_34_plen_112_part_00